MKIFPVLLLLGCLLSLRVLAETSPQNPAFIGIVNLPGHKAALVEVSPAGSAPSQFIMIEGQREGAIEVMRIKPEAETVELNVAGTNVQLKLRASGAGDLTPSAKSSLRLINADIEPVLRLYAAFKGRTLLRSPRLPAVSVSLETTSTNLAEVAQVIEKALAEKSVTTIPDGEKFQMIVPASEAAAVKPASMAIKPSIGKGEDSALIPPGAINFSGPHLTTVAQIYAAFIDCKLDPTQRFPEPTLPIKFQNQTPLSKEELIYALETLFRWQGVKVVRVGDGLVKLVRE